MKKQYEYNNKDIEELLNIKPENVKQLDKIVKQEPLEPYLC